jgi:predicted O-linked N-acetylglucosamine transferase (SPINDLY family)
MFGYSRRGRSPVDARNENDEDLEGRFAEAAVLFQARNAGAAESRLREILSQWPNHAPSLNLLALIAGRDGRDTECVMLLERAIVCGSAEQAAASALILGAAHERARRAPEAEAAYRRALEITPKGAEAHLKLGLLRLRLGRHEAALEPLTAAAALDARLPVAHGALASALCAIGDLAAAGESALRALELAPNDPNFVATLALVRNAQGRFAEAEALCLRALAEGEEPGLLNTLGVALRETARLDEAGAAFERASALRSGFVDALYNLAAVRKDQGRTDEAIGLLREVAALAPDVPAARFALCMAHLPPFYIDEAEIETRRADYAAELDALAALADRVGAGALAPGVGAAQPFYLAYQGRNDVQLQKRYGALVCRAMAEAYPTVSLASPPVTGERIRVGVISGHIRRHSVWRLPTRGWVEGLDRSRFEVLGYHTSPFRDAETDRAERLFDRFVQGPLSVDGWRERIIADRPHALIYPEVGMDPMVARLAAMRLAPVQYAAWGHPSTTGYPTIDYFLSSAAMEPDDGDSHYSERLVRLPGLSTPAALEPLVAPIPPRAALGLPPAATVYWCGQSLYKYLPRHDEVFAAIAAKAPGSRFVFIEFPGSPALTLRFQGRLAAAFSARGLDAEALCVWLPRMTPDACLAAMGCADVVLDSLGWSGCNSLLDGLTHGLPVVTLPGPTMRSRHGAAILSLVGLDHLICPTLGEYVEVAAGLTKKESRESARRILERNRFELADRRALPALEHHIGSSVLGS